MELIYNPYPGVSQIAFCELDRYESLEYDENGNLTLSESFFDSHLWCKFEVYCLTGVYFKSQGQRKGFSNHFRFKLTGLDNNSFNSITRYLNNRNFLLLVPCRDGIRVLYSRGIRLYSQGIDSERHTFSVVAPNLYTPVHYAYLNLSCASQVKEKKY